MGIVPAWKVDSCRMRSAMRTWSAPGLRCLHWEVRGGREARASLDLEGRMQMSVVLRGVVTTIWMMVRDYETKHLHDDTIEICSDV